MQYIAYFVGVFTKYAIAFPGWYTAFIGDHYATKNPLTSFDDAPSDVDHRL